MSIVNPCSLIILDLDGTLFDTRVDLARSVNHALAARNLATHTLPTIVSFIGNGSLNLIRKSVGEGNDALVNQVHQEFMDHYGTHCTIDTKPYAGVKELIEMSDIRLAILTNKPIAPTLTILRHFGWESRFEVIFGGDTAPQRKPAPDGILAILQRTSVPLSEAIMVGDDVPDIRAAKNAKIRSVALLGGFGDAEILKAENPDFTAPTMDAFVRLLAK